MTNEAQLDGIMRHFVLAEPRRKQVIAVDYIAQKYDEGYNDIVIAAPTGIGKSAIGATACLWSSDIEADGFENGGYYLVTQKLLQDQLEGDFKNYQTRDAARRCRSIKSSSEYHCDFHGTCNVGMTRPTPCKKLFSHECFYQRMKSAWVNATMSVTNYPYLFTEHSAAGQLPPRKVLVLDECHTLERQILKFVEITLDEETLRRWTPLIKKVPVFRDVMDFSDYLAEEYIPLLQEKLMFSFEAADDSAKEQAMAKEKAELENYYGRMVRSVSLIRADPSNWIFWQEATKRTQMEAVAKPLDAAPFAKSIVLEMGHVRVYMSAYPGSKRVFCKSLGLDEKRVAWLNLNSTFPVENRKIYLSMVGSMSRRNRDETFPRFIKFTQEILQVHGDTKGIIHCNSYELGEAIAKALDDTPHGKRLIFPRNADDRERAFNAHKKATDPTVMISPSITEGFDFANDLARWQIIAKIPYPYLGDRQVAAKKDRDPDWYDLETVKIVVQACGRIVRSDEDVGETYILDADFLQLWERCEAMFPKWWTEALVWPERRR